MKKLILVAVMLFGIKAFAQNFEGTIKWSMKMDITDPNQKAQMENAKKQMDDPANQAKMKEMQEKMNDPQFKAMMDNNPQMKAQMEKMMGALQGGGDMSSLIPRGISIKIKNKNTLTKLEGGMFASEVLHLADKDQTYTIDRQNKTYSLLNPPANDAKSTSDPDVKVTKTSETATILNYTCTKYIVEISEKGHAITQNIWSTTEIKDFDLKAMSKQRFGKGQRMYFDKIDGVPLKIEMKTPEAGITMEATEIKKELLSASDFSIPADFKKL